MEITARDRRQVRIDADHNLRLGAMFLGDPQDFQSIFARHYQIGQHHVKGLLFPTNNLQSFFSVTAASGMNALFNQEILESRP